MSETKTLGQLAKEQGMSVEELFCRLYVDSGRYRCMTCGREDSDSWSVCPQCHTAYQYAELPWKPKL